MPHSDTNNTTAHDFSSSATLEESIKSEAKRLGFFACGIAQAGPVDAATQQHVRTWVAEKDYATMEYMSNNLEKRLDPTLLVPGTKSIISLALNYAPKQEITGHMPDNYNFAAYALGKDYHDIMKKKMTLLANKFGWTMIPNPPRVSSTASTAHGDSNTDESYPTSDNDTVRYRCFVDSAPVLERYWAVKAGLGWIGRNHSLIIPHAGTMFFLGEIFVSISLNADKPVRNFCGQCRRCIDACPTHALSTTPFDTSLCLSYQTIENRGELSTLAKKTMGDTIYGCDRCQQACPWNRFATPTTDPDMQPSEEFLKMTKEDWRNLDIEQYRRLFKGSAVKRAKYEGLMRNIKAASEEEQ
jgi:epoxyqueuosine reductase